MQNLSYWLMYSFYLVILLGVSSYVYKLRKSVDEMHGMMVGMTLGMISGLATSTLFLIPTGDFLYGTIIGSIVGIIFGVLFGKLGGHLGIVEGIVAGPMGGMMGAMLGQMVRPFDIDIFIPFFSSVFVVTLLGITYAVNCGVSCCKTQESNSKQKLSDNFIFIWTFAIALLILISIILPFQIVEQENTSQPQTTDYRLQTNSQDSLPPFFQELTKEEKKETTIKDNYQEIDLRITSSRYSPNVIIAKKNLLLKINLYADKNAGCAREIVFPDFNINKIVPVGGKETIEFTPTKEGEYKFRCSMDMVRGKLIVK
jgi:heme/copper-type cytochrome/quinol oxidase subunit 2